MQGRLPIRVELKALTKEDFRRILTETEASLIRQYKALLETEGVNLDFTDDAIDALADVAVHAQFERREYRRPPAADRHGAGARRNLLRRAGQVRRFALTIDADYVKTHVGDLAANTDLSRYIL